MECREKSGLKKKKKILWSLPSSCSLEHPVTLLAVMEHEDEGHIPGTQSGELVWFDLVLEIFVFEGFFHSFIKFFFLDSSIVHMQYI